MTITPWNAASVVNTTTSNRQESNVTQALATGRVVTVWSDITGPGGGDIKFRLHDYDGSTVLGETVATAATANEQITPTVAALPDGGFVIVWVDSPQAGNGNILMRRFNEFGVATTGDQVVADSPGNQFKPAVAVTTGGGLVITWDEFNTAVSGLASPGSAVVARLFDAAGAPLGAGPTRVSGSLGASQDSAVAALGDSVVVVWDDNLGPSAAQNGEDGIYGRVYGGPFPTGDGPITRLEDGPFREANRTPDVALAGPNFSTPVIAWADFDPNPGSPDGYDILVNFNGAGTRANGTTALAQDQPTVAGLANGGYVVAWRNQLTEGQNDLRATLFDANGVVVGTETILFESSALGGNPLARPSVSGMLDGRFALSWEQATTSTDVGLRYFETRTAAVSWIGGALGEGYAGTAAGDYLDGGLGNDRINGYGGADSILGGAGSDRLNGGDGGDFLFGGGFDANGAFTTATGGDTLEGGLGDDGLWGMDGDDGLVGGDGNDALVGGAGNDDLQGGLGADFLFGGDFVGGAPGAGSGNDTLNGGDGVDAVYGFDGDDFLFGGTGDDYIEGGAGNDQLTGGAGNDYLQGGAGADILRGNSGFDYLFGQTGADVFNFRFGDSYDSVFDFSKTEGDRLQFDPSLGFAGFTGLMALAQDTSFGGTQSTTFFFAASNDQLTVFGVRPADFVATMIVIG